MADKKRWKLNNFPIVIVILLLVSFSLPSRADAWHNHRLFRYGTDTYENHSFKMPAAGELEVAFSPNEGSEALVLKVIYSAHGEIDMLAYSFTSAPITRALIRAKKRGVSVHLVADEKSNVLEDRSGRARAALSALVNAGCDVRVISVYPIHHDKVIIADRDTVELESYNYSWSAAHRNSENVLVNWNDPALAKIYLKHFDRNYRQSVPYRTRY